MVKAVGTASLAVVLGAHATAEPRVTVSGGADATGQVYTWSVTNHHNAPVVSVEFKHYRGNVFIVPVGWSAEGSTFRDAEGLVSAEAKCVGRAEDKATAIAPGASEEFRLLMDVASARRGRGEMVIGFADGTETRVTGVELPRKAALGDRYVSLIGLGVVFVAWMVYQAVRRRVQPAQRG